MNFIIMALAMMMVFVSCDHKKKQETTPVQTITSLDVDKAITLDKEWMFKNYGQNYKFFESQVLFNKLLTEEDPQVVEVTNIFQYNLEGSSDVFVVMFTHNVDGYENIQIIESFWIEDFPLNDEEYEYDFKACYNKLMEANIVKPHSRHATLRKQVGPVAAPAQWIFGNIKETVFVDTVTGEVSGINPFFLPTLEMPLGEWP